jgi:hypothetical protein
VQHHTSSPQDERKPTQEAEADRQHAMNRLATGYREAEDGGGKALRGDRACTAGDMACTAGVVLAACSEAERRGWPKAPPPRRWRGDRSQLMALTMAIWVMRAAAWQAGRKRRDPRGVRLVLAM